MIEGWLDRDYLILFSDAEAAVASAKYSIAGSLPGYTIVGLKGWDDFIVCDATGKTYTVTTVPIDPEYLAPFQVPENPVLTPDPRVTGKIKWHVHPLVFGGKAMDANNLTWVDHDTHAQLVVFWNRQYRAARGGART